MKIEILKLCSGSWRKQIAMVFALFPGLFGTVLASTQTYDTLNRLTSITYADGSRIEYRFDANGNRTMHRTEPPQLRATVYPLASEVPGTAGSLVLDVTANGPWTASSDAPWISFDPASAPGSASPRVNHAANSSYRARLATVRIGNAVHQLRQAARGGLPPALVSEPLDRLIAGEGTILSVTGLPSGLAYNSRTGRLSGRPNSGGNSMIVVRARLASGAVVEDRLPLQVEPLPAFALGSFTSLVAPPALINGTRSDLGGVVTVSSSTNGLFTGSLRVGPLRYGFRGRIDGLASSARGDAPLRSSVLIQPSRYNRTLDILLNLEFRPESATTAPGLTGSLVMDARTLPLGPGWRHEWNARTNPAWGNRDRTLNVALVNDTATGPHGNGFAVVKLSRSGVATWYVTLADGTRTTSALMASPAGDIPFYASLGYRGGGSIFGLAGIEIADNLAWVVPSAEPIGHWRKRASNTILDRSYPEGFSVNLEIAGGEYRPPALGWLLFDPAPVSPVPLEFRFTCTGLEDSWTFGNFAVNDSAMMPATLGSNNRLGVDYSDAAVPVLPAVSFASGQVSGSMGLPYDSVNGYPIKRTLAYNGLFIPSRGGNPAFRGYLLLPQMPSLMPTSIPTPISSGRFTIGHDVPPPVTPPVDPSATTVLSDNFDDATFDTSKWVITKNGATRVAEENGVMKVETTSTDKPGTLTTKNLRLSTKRSWTLTRKVYLHRATPYAYQGGTKFFSGFMLFHITGMQTFGINYMDFDYSSVNDFPKHGFFMTKNGVTGMSDPASGNMSPQLAPLLLDTWFTEKVVYDPVIGMLSYYLNDVFLADMNVGIPAGNEMDMFVEFQGYGWWSTHYQHFDDIEIKAN